MTYTEEQKREARRVIAAVEESTGPLTDHNKAELLRDNFDWLHTDEEALELVKGL
jgi:hypothetical protein